MIRSRQYPGTKPAGDGDVDVPVEEIEMILPSLHTKDRKGSITSAWEIFASEQRQATGSLPSSCGWTFLLFVYAILVISLLSLLRVTPSVTLHLFHLYYQPLLPPIFMLFLWGIAVRYFEDHGIQYELCFGKEDRKYLLASTAIFYLSLILSLFVFLSGCAFLYLSLSGFQGVAAWQPTLVYAGLLAALLLPHPFLYQVGEFMLSENDSALINPLLKFGQCLTNPKTATFRILDDFLP